MNRDSILYQSKQMWKYRTSQILTIFAIFVIYMAFKYSTTQFEFGILIGAAFVSLIASLVLPYSIQCPGCHVHWWWESLKTPALSKQMIKYLSQHKCPSCGYPNHDVT
jgi:hypothetical protein